MQAAKKTFLAGIVGFVLVGCGGSSNPDWKSLRSVRISVAQPGLPPPFGKPKITVFTTPAEVSRATAALNQNHIAKKSSFSTDDGCSGGYEIAIVIVASHSSPTRLQAYRCANTTSGDINGNLVGFLSAVGVAL